MISNKLGTSVPWLYRTTNNKFIRLDAFSNFISLFFKKQNIPISEIFVREFPLYIFFYFTILPTNKKQYKFVKPLLNILAKLILLITRKNVSLSCKIASTLFYSPDILGHRLKTQIYNNPSNIKKIIKRLALNYATTIKQSKNRR